MDPQRANRVRRSFIDTVQRLDPLDALVLKEMAGWNPGSSNSPGFRFRHLKVSDDELHVSAINLYELRCISTHNSADPGFQLTPYGRELVRACGCSD